MRLKSNKVRRMEVEGKSDSRNEPRTKSVSQKRPALDRNDSPTKKKLKVSRAVTALTRAADVCVRVQSDDASGGLSEPMPVSLIKSEPLAYDTDFHQMLPIAIKVEELEPDEPPPLEDFDPNDSSVDFVEDFLLPLLIPENEIILYKWMLKFKLLKTPNICGVQECKGVNFRLVPHNKPFRDTHFWKCDDCNRATSLRIESFFAPLMCTIQQAFFCILAWCKGTPPELTIQITDVKLPVAKRIYQTLIETVQYFMKDFSNDILLGGKSTVVLLDVWPKGIPVLSKPKKKNRHRSWSRRFTILWLADTMYVPVQCCAYILPPMKPLQLVPAQEESTDVKRSTEDILETDSSTGSQMVEIKQEVDIQLLKETQNCQETTNDSRQIRLDRRRILRENQIIQEELMPLKPKVQVKDEKEDEEEKASQKKRKKSQEDLERELKARELKEKQKDYERKKLVEAVVSMANDHIARDSLVVANENALPGIVNLLNKTGRYEAVRSTDDLVAANLEDNRPVSSILDNIWNTAHGLCEEVRDDTRLVASYKLAEFHWRQYFGDTQSNAVFNILSHLTSHLPQNVKSTSNFSSSDIEAEN